MTGQAIIPSRDMDKFVDKGDGRMEALKHADRRYSTAGFVILDVS
jgi:hypothetical protein